jgi:hypothetical protein
MRRLTFIFYSTAMRALPALIVVLAGPLAVHTADIEVVLEDATA